MVAAALGCSPVIALGESFAGVIVGGRTGLTAVWNAVFFLLALPLAPIFAAIPTFASAPVLVLLGVDRSRVMVTWRVVCHYISIQGATAQARGWANRSPTHAIVAWLPRWVSGTNGSSSRESPRTTS